MKGPTRAVWGIDESGGGGGRETGWMMMPQSRREMISVGRDGENGGRRKCGRKTKSDLMASGVGGERGTVPFGKRWK